ncbi:hypothetical protein [Streptomyces sp. NPDC058457]|uniref:hypothetical protein n=1 Tax=Streptomyces sp. NPDC058457 TaxID=3346507 RepID=UPI0036673EBE
MSQAVSLGHALDNGLDGLTRRFFADAIRVTSLPWWMSTLADSDLPGVEGPKVPSMRLATGYLDRVLTAVSHGPNLATDFVKVICGIAPPATLMRPGILIRVIRPRTAKPAP